ncbi:phage tail protein I [Vibrio hepatarius]|uniref:phage tail protein I n=1 Tax=Vibrio hepatarius TaxID=171383 RepID=UPI001C0966F7|nr:phage tail protein I [Vibrio hepatarius]MBU2897684.1 phage tail protein I [Vibrio hepatarius]
MSEQNEPFNSIQPSNRTIIEESLEYAWVLVLEKLESPYPNLKNPLLCPDEFVAVLAGERGVQDWQPGDTLEQQRSTTDKAFEIHSKAGTRYGLRTSLNALGFDSTISKGIKPYSLEVEAYLQDKPLTEESSQRVDTRVGTYKSERDDVSINISRQSSGEVYVGVTTEIGVTMTSKPYVPDGFTSEAVPSIGVYNHIRVIATSEPASQ